MTGCGKPVLRLAGLMALGALIAAAWAATPSYIKFSVSSAEIEEFLGTDNAKLVFVDRYENTGGVLCYADFSQAADTPAVVVITAPENVKVPAISPDGNWIVYVDVDGPGGEAGSSESSVSSSYICGFDASAEPVLVAADNAFEPRFTLDPESLAVIYSTKAPNYAWNTDAQTMKAAVDVSGARPVVGTPEKLTDGGYTGGMSLESEYICGGGGNVALYALDGAGEADTVSLWPQSCNACISPSRLRHDALMCLSFGGEGIEEIRDGAKWGQWQIIHIVRPHNDARDEMLRYYDRPAPSAMKYPIGNTETSLFTGATKWHHPEWSNHPYFAVATVNTERAWVENPDGYKKPEGVGEMYRPGDQLQEKVCIINLRTGDILEILRLSDESMNWAGVDTFHQLFWPYLWVEVEAGFAEQADWMTMEYQESQPIRFSFPPSVRGSRPQPRTVFFDGYELTSLVPIRRIGLNDVLGREIAVHEPAGSAVKSVVVGDAFGWGTGVYFLRVETTRGTVRTFRWVVAGK